jgi:apolipoprotein N-acyltransferase
VVVLLLAAGVGLTVLAYPPAAVPGLGLVMLAPVFAALEGASPRRAFALVYLYSVVMAVALLRWVLVALVDEYGVAVGPSWIFLLLIVGSFAVFPSLAGAIYAWLRPRIGDVAAPGVLASLWTLSEWVRGEALGVPWLLAAQAWARIPIAIQGAELGGMWAVGAVFTAFNAGLALALRRRRATPLVVPGAVLGLALGFGAWRLAAEPAPTTARVGVVQASVPQSERFRPGSAERNVKRHVDATLALAGRESLDLVVWSETAVDVDLDRHPELGSALAALATRIGAPLVTGAPRSGGGSGNTNAVVLFAPGRGLVESYAKQRLVPFSEYDPPLGAPLVPLLGPVTEGQPYVPGREPTVFHAGPIPFSTPVCFEITYPHLVRRFQAAGARLLVNVSNDAWFGPKGYPDMHLAHAVFRAVELRTWVVRGANTGISAAIDPLGRLVAELPAFEEGSFAVDVAASGAPTPYARAGDAPVLAALVVLALAGGLAGLRSAPRAR